MRANAGSGEGGAVSAELSALLARLGELAGTTPQEEVSDAARIDRIALLEQVRAGVAAAQQAEMVAFAKSQVEAQIANESLDPKKVGRGIADQIALACRVSPWTGSRRLGIARALHSDLPETGRLLREGRISEDLAGRVVSETTHLDPERRGRVDERLAGVGLEDMSPAQAAATARRFAYEADRAGYTERGRTARKDRRVGLRPAPDTMSVLSGFLPVEQGVACLAALRAHTDAIVAHGDERSRDQIMADTLVERVTGQARAGDVNAEVNIVIPVDALLDPDSNRTADLVGHGPVPAAIVHDLLADTAGRRWWRRLFARPDHGGMNGPLIGGDPRRRLLDGFLAHLIGLRDGGRCRDPLSACSPDLRQAPIRHTDHIKQARADGPTSYTNGRGVCVRGNQVREMPGWHVETIHDGLGPTAHTVRTTTPTGHRYDSRAGP